MADDYIHALNVTLMVEILLVSFVYMTAVVLEWWEKHVSIFIKQGNCHDNYMYVRVTLAFTLLFLLLVGELPIKISNTRFEPGLHNLTVIVNSTHGQIAEDILLFTVPGNVSSITIHDHSCIYMIVLCRSLAVYP